MATTPDPIENIIGWTVAIVLIAIAVVPVIWGHFHRSRVLEHGIDAKAKIVGIKDTGRRHNTNPVVRFDLMVTDEKGQDYRAEVTMPVSPVHLAGYQVGSMVRVKYDPKKPTDVAIVMKDSDTPP